MADSEKLPQADTRPFGLESFQSAPADDGLTLDDLSRAFAAMLDSGHDPYRTAVAASDDPPEAAPPGGPDSGLPERLTIEDEPPAPGAVVTPKSIVEAMLFAGTTGERSLGRRQMAALMRGVSPDEIDEIIGELNSQYAQNGCPYWITDTGHGYQMVLREEYAELAERAQNLGRAVRLSQAAIDVLAIVAYGQPMAGEDVSRLRGRPSNPALAQLVRRDLLRLERDSDDPRQIRYSTTERFLRLFNLNSIDDLPNTQDLDQRSSPRDNDT
jgi:segregation and condensation protein B